METNFYVGDVVIIKKGPHADYRWNTYEMSKYIGKEAVVSLAENANNHFIPDADKRYRLKGLEHIGMWVWTGEDFILKEKRCSHCEKTLEGEEVIVSDKRMCPECAEQFKKTCSCCGEEFYTTSCREVDGKSLCQKCFTTRTKTCPLCNNRYFIGKGYIDEYGNEYCSPNCKDNYRLENEEMMDYGEKPDPVFYGKANELHLGVELEIDTKREEYGNVDDLVYELSLISGKHFCKEDGSLSSDGIEIVTQPCTLEFHRNSFGWADIVDKCRSYDYYSDQVSTCGMHIHVDRSYFNNSEEAAVKISYLLYKFKEEFVNFSRRRNGALEQWAYIKEIDNLTNIRDTYANLTYERYRALNVCNRNTLEFRLWKGSLNLETIFATMQMTQTICDIVKEVENIEDLTWLDICNYHDFKELKSYLLRRNLITETEIKEEVA